VAVPITIVMPGQLPRFGPRDGRVGNELVELAESEGDGPWAVYPHPGSESELALHEPWIPPDTEIAPHVHREDEIIYVVAGEMHLGARVLSPGASVYIPGNTLYGFRSGPDGLKFLNFRARRDPSHISKAEFLAERAARTGP
jgi:mannose-6-phosphate isomerase-like protein (cupin superfamily)